jgi:beta-galactosidase
VPDACPDIMLRLEGEGRILGAGNGDPAYKGPEQPADGRTLRIPAFNGYLQVLVEETGACTLYSTM